MDRGLDQIWSKSHMQKANQIFSDKQDNPPTYLPVIMEDSTGEMLELFCIINQPPVPVLFFAFFSPLYNYDWCI